MSRPLRVLLVEDNPDDADLILGELRRADFRPEWIRVETEENFLMEIARLPDIILSDYSMPQFSGLRAAELLRLSGFKIPFILISGTVGEEVAVAAMRQGATDYLLKDRMGRLGNAVDRALAESTASRERSVVEMKLLAAQLQLQKTLEHSPVVIYSLKLSGKQLVPQMVSENIFALLGHTVDECLADDWWDNHLHPEDVEKQRVAVDQQTNGDSLNCEYRVRHKKGHYVWMEDRRRILRDHNGIAFEISGAWIDISARKQSERELELLNRNHALILNSVDEGIQGIDRNGTIVFENIAATKMFGWEANELVGADAHARVHHSNPDGSPLPTDQCRIQATLRDGISRRVDDEVFWRKDGTCFPIEYVVAPQLDPDGSIVGAVVVFHNIAERRSLEAQLRQSQKLESIGQLAGGVAHDFNNILTIILMHADLTLLSENVPKDFHDSVVEIKGAADRAANLTRQLLLFSRKQVMQPLLLELNTTVTSLMKMLQRIVPEDVDVQVNLHPSPLCTIADSGMLDQVLMNLAVNARDAMPDGGSMIISTCERTFSAADADAIPELSPGRYVGFSVQDTGTGIPLDIRSRIFEPFFTTKEIGKGSGLGMSTVFGAVQQHKGWLDLQSEVGVGTTVTVFLPAQEADFVTRSGDRIGASTTSGTESILVAEDDRAVRLLTRRVLELSGYTVAEAVNGVEALRVWQEHSGKFALLLTDLVMPGGINGRQLARMLQTERPSLKVLFTSGYSADIAGRELALQAGQYFIQKPCRAQSLLNAVREALD